MAKKKNNLKTEAAQELSDQASSPAVSEAPAPKPAKVPVKISLEQVALANEKKLTPRFKPQHLPSVMAFCKSTGLPTSGTEEEMLAVLKRYGYKF